MAPANDTKHDLNPCRAASPALPAAELLSQLSSQPDSSGNDSHAAFRDAVCQELAQDLQPADRPFLRWLLEQEMASHRAAKWGVNENIVATAELLCQLGQAEDALLIWQAKNVNFDTHCALGIRLVAGADLAATRRYLESLGTAEATDALNYLAKAEACGDLDPPPA